MQPPMIPSGFAQHTGSGKRNSLKEHDERSSTVIDGLFSPLSEIKKVTPVLNNPGTLASHMKHSMTMPDKTGESARN